MLCKLVILVVILVVLVQFNTTVSSQESGFIFNGFPYKNLTLENAAIFTPNGLLKLSGGNKQHSHAIYPNQINFKNLHNSSSVFSFSTTFVFAIVSEYSKLSSQGMTFFIVPTKAFVPARPEYLGLSNETTTANATNHIFAVELDTVQNEKFDDIDGNHVGIDINGLKSKISQSAGYYRDNSTSKFLNLSLYSGLPMQVWVEYSASKKQVNVTLAPLDKGKPRKPLLSLDYDLDPVINEEMYVGFSCTTGSRLVTSHYVLGWSFMVNGMATELDLLNLPKLPRIGPKKKSKSLTTGLPLILVTMFLMTTSGVVYYIRRKKKFAEVLEDWELEYGPHRFKYKELYVATKGFKDKDLLGKGGFGVAAGLSYLHQEWEQVVIHRDVKASNVLLDNQLNGRLGDFGLARLYDHGTDPQTTHVVGTIGYLAPEHNRTGKATTSTDVYSFGVFLLEVTCGKRPIHVRHGADNLILADWVCSYWNGGDIVATVDPKLGPYYVKEEAELVLKLGLMCCNSEALARPKMRQVVQYLEGHALLPELSSIVISSVGLAFEPFSSIDMSNYSSSSLSKPSSQPYSVTADSFSCGGR
ncbi:Protein kinase domain-containing protein [Heracleum sosnowskyi]|uniref:non-specific serine/threonine protein kinase n=1 Tax=Heracleum sosnowskyi TaxID=360622 RepID=A0AAD8J5Z9_9APIA|nr:Protein kinase domain-containing protein [Heracleum sosnowskyi]